MSIFILLKSVNTTISEIFARRQKLDLQEDKIPRAQLIDTFDKKNQLNFIY